MEKYLSINNLYLKLGSTKILNGVTFKINKGSKVALIGPNGSGKTTLFNSISGFHQINKGEIIFNGHDITKLAPHKRAQLGIGRVFQNFGIFKELTVLDNLRIAIENRPQSNKLSTKQIIDESIFHLSRVKLDNLINKKASELSGGQMRLLEIIRTVSSNSEFLLLDEPTAGVSPKMKIEIVDLLEQLNQEGRTIFITEHDMNFVHDLCNQIIVLNLATVALEGTTEEVRQSEHLKEIYLGRSSNRDEETSLKAS